MVIHFTRKKRFTKNFEEMSKESQERVLKELKKWKKMGDMAIQHIKFRSPHLKADYGGIRHISLERIRIYFMICDECRTFGHDRKYGRCEKCPKEKDLIVLVDVEEFRKDETYANRDFSKDDVKDFNGGTYEV